MSAVRWGAAVTALAAVAAGAFFWWRHDPGPDARLREGRAAVRKADWGGVEKARRRLEETGHPDLAHLLQGEAYLSAGAYADAVAEFNQIKDQGAIRREAAARTGRCLRLAGRRLEAERALRFAVADGLDDVEAYRDLAAIDYDQGNMDLAADELRAVARLDPRDGRPYRLLGVIHQDMEQWDDAVAAYHAALAREGLSAGERAEARLDLAECLLEKKDYEAGLRELGALDGPDAAGATALAVRAECLTGLRRTAEAGTVLDRGLAAHPGDVRLLRLRAEAYLDAGAPKEAAALLEKAAAADPNDHRVRYQLALAYNGLGRAADAAEQQRRFEAIQKDRTRRTDLTREAMRRPWDAGVRRELAAVCDRLGRPKLAAMWRQAADACPPQGPAATP